MEERQGTLTGGDYNQTAKVISYGDSAKNYITRLARKVKEIAGTAKEKSLPEALRKTTNKVADGLESAGSYIEERKFQKLPSDLITLIRKHPVQLLLLCGGLGLYLARRRKGVARASSPCSPPPR